MLRRRPRRLRLLPEAIATAHRVGAARDGYATGRGLSDHYQAAGERSTYNHIVGVMGELAAAQVTGLDWDEAIGRLGGPDLGYKVEARTRDVASGKDLFLGPLKDLEKGASPFVLVHLLSYPDGIVVVQGWILGRDAMTDRFAVRYKAYPDGAWFVPPAALNDIETLLPYLRAQES